MGRTFTTLGLAVLVAGLGAGAASGQSCYTWREVGEGPQIDPHRSCIAYSPALEGVLLVDGSVGEHWMWDGLGWTPMDVASQDDLLDHQGWVQMAYDRDRGVMVLGSTMWIGILFEWDGGPDGWHYLAPGGDTFGFSSQSRMVYDAARSEMVIVGGAVTYLYDGATITKVPQGPDLNGSALVYDALRERVVMFGGSRAGAKSNETWEWDGQAWTQLSPGGAPPARSNHSLAYDPVRSVTVLFGGTTGSEVLGDTWEWDGQTWTQILPAESPSPRWTHLATYDELRAEVVLYDGYVDLGGTQDRLLYRRDVGTPRILEQPRELTVEEGGLAAFGATATGEVLGYQWYRDRVMIEGATSAMLAIDSVGPADAGAYSVRISHRCGELFSQPALLTVEPVCDADFDGDGRVDTRDVLAFLNGWTAGCP